LYTGKGGVGKTTTAAATAVCAARRGLHTLVASADAAHSLGDVLEQPLGPEPQLVLPGPAGRSGRKGPPGRPSGRRPEGRLEAIEVDARVETERHWGAIHEYLFRIFRYQGIEDVVAEELALLPGAEELTTLLAVKGWAEAGEYDLVVVDCAPTGSALRLLTLPEVARGTLRFLLRMQRALSAAVTPLARNLVPLPLPDSRVFRDAEDFVYQKLSGLRQLVSDPQTTTRLVVTPERMVIDEALRAHTDLALFELPCDAVVLNRLLPEAAAEEAYFEDWARLQEERRREVEQDFEPLPVLPAPLQDDEVTGLSRLAAHGDALFAKHQPADVLCTAPRVRFETVAPGVRAHVPMPHAEPDAIDVVRVDGALVITSGARRRSLPLPRPLHHFDLVAVRLEGGTLLADFAREGAAS